jgi:hypothetical protein
MALRIRRGTNAERQTIVFAQGELVYTTDTKDLFIGDGTTLGGVIVSGGAGSGIGSLVEDLSPQLGGDLDLNQNEITGIGDIDITGTVTADIFSGGIFIGDGSGLTNLPTGNEIVDGSNYRINIISDDSSVMVNSEINEIRASTGFFDEITASTGSFEKFRLVNNFLDFSAEDISNTESQELRVSSNNNRSFLTLSRSSEWEIDNLPLGSILFEKDDVNGTISNGIIIGRTNSIIISSDDTGVFDLDTFVTVYNGGLLGVGTAIPEAKLDVRGDAIVSGTITATSFNGSLVGDNSTTIIDAIDGSITAQSFVQFGSLTTLERDSLNAVNGMVIYNTTANKFQGYQNSGWINLDTGSAA